MVCSFFLCHRHLWSVLSFFATGICVQSLSFAAFSAVGIRVRLFVFALLALVSGYQCISQFLVSCCALAARLEISNWIFFQVGYPVDSPTNFALKQTLFGIPPSSLRNRTRRSARYTNGRDWGAASTEVSSFELYKFDPFSPHSGSIPRELVHS